MQVSFFVHYKEFCTSFPYEKNGNETIFIAVSTVPCGNRTHNCPLGVQVPTGNLYNFKLIQVKERLDFTDFPVNPCQNKKTENHPS